MVDHHHIIGPSGAEEGGALSDHVTPSGGRESPAPMWWVEKELSSSPDACLWTAGSSLLTHAYGFRAYLFCRKNCKIRSQGCWKYLDVSEL
jgi:hypothetical protein